MYLPQLLRENIFWFLDRLHNSDIKKHLSDIKNIVENSGKEEVELLKQSYLEKILNHAVSTTWFYQKCTGYSSIRDFTIINKNDIRDHFESFISSKFDAKKCVKVSTSGSTGSPFSVLQDTRKRYRNTADNLYFSHRSGYKIGYQLHYVKIWPDNYKPHFFSRLWWKNIHPQSVFELQDRDIEEFILRLKKDNSVKSFLGYTSAYEKICQYLDKSGSGPLECNVVSIISMSEALNEYTTSSMKKYFGVTPVSRYSNNENGILAQQDRGQKKTEFLVNSASYFIEIFDLEKDIPLRNGELGRIVVTDLHNYAMPLIRYDTGDVGAMRTDKNNRTYLTTISGRKMDLIYDTTGNIVPSHISYKLCKYGNYKQFQLVQYGEKDYMIKLNTDKKVDESNMLDEFYGYLGKDANIHIKYVDEIPLLSSGKRKEVMNTYHSKS